MAMKFRQVSTCLALLLAASFTIATVSADLPNWVSPVNASQSGCYRKTYFSRKTCAQGYESDGVATCWAQCPLNYPVECGVECIPQSADCTSQMLKKVSSVGTVALNAATAGIFGELVKASKAITLGVKCSQKLYTASSSLKDYVDELQANGTEPKQILTLVNQSDLVINQLPTAVATCLGLPVSEDTLKLNAEVASIVNQLVMEIVANGASLLHPKNFLAFMSDLGVDDSVKDMDGDSVAELQDVLSSGVTCGSKLQVITDQVTQFIVAVKQKDPGASVSAIRQALSVSKLLVSDIPDVTNNCVRNLTEDAFTTRDSLRSIMSTITDGLVDKSVDKDGKSTSIADYLASVAKMGLDVIGILDPTGIADMLSTFIQPICGPTAFMGEIDDGSLEDALALTTEGDAFKGSHGSWKRVGDGAVNITFKSIDTEDVTVNIHSGGDTVAKVKVKSGDTVTWSSTVKELQDKTLYFDRWRPGRFNIPTSAGGSLVLWVPHSSTGGNIQLFVKINGDDENSSESSSSSSSGSGSSTVQVGDSSDESSGSYADVIQVGDDSQQGSGSDSTPVQVGDSSEEGSGSDINVTPAPTTSDNADQVDQSSLEGSNGSDEIDVTPAPTTYDEESATPAPTTPDAGPEQSYSTPTPTPALCES